MSSASSDRPIPERPPRVTSHWKGRQSIVSKIAQFLLRLRLFRTGALVAGFLSLLGLLIWILLYAPKRTPLVAIQTAAYHWPYPPLAWAAEDIASLQDLDGETITLGGIDRLIRGPSDLDIALEDVRRTGTSTSVGKDSPVIIYVSMLGIAEANKAYLVPTVRRSNEQQHNQKVTRDWVEIGEFLSKVAGILPDRQKLVVLDCQRVQVNWHLGLLENDFSSALQMLWKHKSAALANISVLCAAGSGERGHVSRELQGSVFGHYFHLGLAGAADKYSVGGDQDGQVTLRELENYLNTTVTGWVQLNRADSQTPLLLTAADNFVLVSSLNAESLEEVLAKASDRLGSTTDASASVKGQLWEFLEKFRLESLYRHEPFAWRELEHKLLWLDALEASGSRYRTLATRSRDELQSWVAQIETRLRSTGRKRSLRKRQALLQGTRDDHYDKLAIRSLPLAEHLDTLKPAIVEAVREQWQQFEQSPVATQLKICLEQLEGLDAQGLTNSYFLKMIQRYQSSEIWQQRGRLHQLLNLRAKAESLATPRQANGLPGDERGHYWVRTNLETANESRRTAEDQLFVSSQPRLFEHLTETAELLTIAESNQSKLQYSLQVRDRALSEVGYLAQWLAHPANRPDASQSIVKSSQVPLSSFVTLIRQLGSLIDDHSQLSQSTKLIQASVTQIEGAAKRVQQSHLLIKKRFDIAARRLLETEGKRDVATNLRQIEALLESPLLQAKDRRGLEKIRRIGAAKLCQLSSIPLAENYMTSSTSEASADKLVAYSKWLKEWETHPLLALLPQKEEATRSRAINYQWRIGLQSLLTEINEAPLTSSRKKWSDLEQALRLIAPIWSSKLEVDPVAKLCRLDLNAILVWHAEESLRDFWGPAGGVASYFQLSATDYLDSAQKMISDQESSAESVLRNHIKRGSLAAQNWIDVESADVVLLQASDDLSVRLNISSNAKPVDLPTGVATVIVRHDGQRIGNVHFLAQSAIEIPARSAELEALIPGDSNYFRRSPLDIQTVFRGHEFSTPLNVGEIGGVIIEQKPFVYQPGRVVLHSPWKKLDVVFVFDASQSMNEPMEGSASRLEVAKSVLERLLTQLSTRRNVRIGLRIFGHRVGWSTDSPVRRLLSPSYAGKVPKNVAPDSDVEQVVPLASLNYVSAGRMFERLQSVHEGWGQSPLYLALEQTFAEDFRSTDSETKKHVVVITDGRNYQFRPEGKDRSSLSAVVSAWGGRDIAVHILGMAMDEQEAMQATPDFSSLAWQTGGSYTNLNSSSVVQETLQRILGLESYKLEDLAGTAIDQSQLGRPLSSQGHLLGGNWYHLRFQNLREPLVLEGGELIDFFLDTPTQTILAFPFESNVATESRLKWNRGTPESDTLLRVHRPLRDETGVLFSLSLQRSGDSDSKGQPTWRWTPRPEQAWVEITPLSTQGERVGQSYHFYDVNYVPDKPVPLLQLMARNWPATAKHARIRAWFQPPTTFADNGLLLAPQEQLAGTISVGDALDVGPGIRIVANDQTLGSEQQPIYRIRVVEYHRSHQKSGGIVDTVGTIKVGIPEVAGQRPTQITRQFDERHGVVVHTFDYAKPEEALIASLRKAPLQVTSLKELQSVSLFAEAARVKISEAGTLIPILGSPLAER